jgi:hypothetical protein
MVHVGANSYSRHLSPSTTAQSAERTELFDATARPSDSVFRSAPRGGVFNFAISAPHPLLTRFFVHAQPVATMTDQELAAIITASDEFSGMPFYIYEAVTRR